MFLLFVLQTYLNSLKLKVQLTHKVQLQMHIMGKPPPTNWRKGLKFQLF